jgi:hypothetical protein
MANWREAKNYPQHGAGITSEIAALLMFGIFAQMMNKDKIEVDITGR